LRNEKVEIVENVPIDVAVNEYHAMALFGEKYGDRVRVIKIAIFRRTLRRHAHGLRRDWADQDFEEGSVSSGVRRIEAIMDWDRWRTSPGHELEGVVSAFASPTFAKKRAKMGTLRDEGHTDAVSPAEALRAELEKKDAEIKRLGANSIRLG